MGEGGAVERGSVEGECGWGERGGGCGGLWRGVVVRDVIVLGLTESFILFLFFFSFFSERR